VKKYILLSLLFILSGCNGVSVDEQQWESYDSRPIVGLEGNNENDECISDCDYSIRTDLNESDISDIKLGMSREEILEKIGRPHSLYGSGFWIDLYMIDESNALFYYSVEDDVVVLDELVVCTSTECKKLVE